MPKSKTDIAPTTLATRLYFFLIAVVLLLVGGCFIYGGFQLVRLGGSLYYLLAGLLLVCSALLLLRADVRAAYLFAAFYIATLVWSLWETGLQFWPLAARLGMFSVIGVLIALCVPKLRGAKSAKSIGRISYRTAAVLSIGVIAAFISAFSPVWLVKPTTIPSVATDYKPENEPDRWVGFGRTPSGEQFAPYSQINRDNVKNLQVAWTFHTGDITGNGSENQNTPLQIGNILYPCTPTNQVFAVRGDTGEQIWHFDPGVKPDATAHWMRCRSLAYYEVPGLADNAPGKKRLYVTTGCALSRAEPDAIERSRGSLSGHAPGWS